MKHLLIILISFLLHSSPVNGQSERPETILVPVSSMGDVSDIRKQILENTLSNELKKYFRIIPQEKYEQVLEQVFEELEYEECSEDTCIMRIQEMLQVENVFNLQIIGEGKDSQLNLKWITLDEKKNEEDYCEGCGTRDLRKMIRGLVEKLVGGKNVNPVVSTRRNDFEVKKKQAEELKKKQAEELSDKQVQELRERIRVKQAEELREKQAEELRDRQVLERQAKNLHRTHELKKKQAEELKKKQAEELKKKKDTKNRIEVRQRNLSYTFRSIGLVNALEYKYFDNVGIGILYENSSTSYNETDGEINELAESIGLYALFSLDGCYYCNTSAYGAIFGYGDVEYSTGKGSEYKYSGAYLILLYGYQWYFESDISLSIFGGLRYRNRSKNSEIVVNNEELNNKYIKSGIDFYPAILIGYSF